jgi:hypothetical protein
MFVVWPEDSHQTWQLFLVAGFMFVVWPEDSHQTWQSILVAGFMFVVWPEDSHQTFTVGESLPAPKANDVRTTEDGDKASI